MHPSQSNTRPVGPFLGRAGESFVAKAAFLAVLTHDTSVPEFKLPTGNNDLALFIIEDEVADGERVEMEQLIPGKTYRTPLVGTCEPGDVLVLADVATPADKGKLRKLPAVAGIYVQVGIADEKGIAAQNVAYRHAPKIVHVASADTITGAADLAALKVALLAILRAHGIVAP